MISPARLYLGLLCAAAGWQTIFEMLGAPLWKGTGAALLAAGAALTAAALPREVRWRGTAGVLLVQAAAAPGWRALFARWHEVDALAPLFASGLRFLGLDAAAAEGRVIVHVGDRVQEILPSLSRLAAFPLALVLTGFLALVILLPVAAPGKLVARVVATLAGYALLRLLALMAVGSELPEQGVDLSLALAGLTLAPAAWLLGPRPDLLAPRRRTARWRAAPAAIAGFCWVLTLAWTDPGRPAPPGRVLFDDSHGAWEPADVPFDTEHFGGRSSYSYSSLYELLGRHYDVRRQARGPLTAEDLAAADVLIVKTPSEPFTVEEIEAIDRFVRAGGGLFMIGDHTNLFGMTTYLNGVARRFGLSFGNDDTWDLATEGASRWRSSALWADPVSAAIRGLEFETSCTLRVPLAARTPILGYALGAEQADYSRPGFFGNIHLDAADDFGFFVQHAIVHHGRGRVAAFCDSTVLSNFSLYFPGRRELVLATLDSLGRESTPWRFLPVAALYLTLAAIVLLAGFDRGGSAAGVGAGLFAGLALATALMAGITAVEIPEARVAAPEIVFDREVSRLTLLGILTAPEEGLHRSLDSFFVAAQRLGAVPRVADDLSRGLDGATVLVLAHPRRDLDPGERQDVRRFVAGGGSLLVIDGLIEPGAATNAVLSDFGLEVRLDRLGVPERAPAREGLPEDSAADGGDRVPGYRPILVPAGGTVVLRDPQGFPIYNETTYGRGRVGLFTDSIGLSRGALGGRFPGQPTPRELSSLRVVFRVLRRLIGAATPASDPIPGDVPESPG